MALKFIKYDTIANYDAWSGQATQYSDTPASNSTNDNCSFPDEPILTLNYTVPEPNPDGGETDGIASVKTESLPAANDPVENAWTGIDASLYDLATVQGWGYRVQPE